MGNIQNVLSTNPLYTNVLQPIINKNSNTSTDQNYTEMTLIPLQPSIMIKPESITADSPVNTISDNTLYLIIGGIVLVLIVIK